MIKINVILHVIRYSKFFTSVIDEIILLSHCDMQLSCVVKLIDRHAQKKNVMFYEIMFNILRDDVDNNNISIN